MSQSNYINHSIKTVEELKGWILHKLGHPLVTVELTDDQLNYCINDAFEIYTKYASFDTKPLVLDITSYEAGVGFNLSAYNIAAVHGLESSNDNVMGFTNDMIWSIPNALMQSGAYPFFGNGGAMGSFVTLHNAFEWVSLAKRMTGSGYSFDYDRYTKYLKLYPEPNLNRTDSCILIMAEVIPSDEYLFGNEYLRRFALAYSKILLGTVRKKFSGVQLIGGGTIDTEIGDEGKEELKELIENIRIDESVGSGMYIG